MVIGLISDTHGFLDPSIAAVFKGVHHILHAGDIGSPEIIDQLENIAPVTAVLGNNDNLDWRYRELEVVELGGFKFLVHHIVDPHRPGMRLAQALSHHQPGVVVFGHTHQTYCESTQGCLYLNPGYSGRPRFGAVRSVARLHLKGPGVLPRFEPVPLQH